MQHFKNITKVAHQDSGTPILATIHRLGLICFRMSMLLTIVRFYHHPKKKQQPTVRIHHTDLCVSMDISMVLLYHANMLIADMKNGSKHIQIQAKQQRFFESLTDEFNWSQAVDLGQKINMSPSSVRRYLLTGQFERNTKGWYRKVVKPVPDEQ